MFGIKIYYNRMERSTNKLIVGICWYIDSDAVELSSTDPLTPPKWMELISSTVTVSSFDMFWSGWEDEGLKTRGLSNELYIFLGVHFYLRFMI